MRPNPYLLVTVGFWGFNFVSLKLIDHALVPPAAMLALRLVVQILILGTVCLAQGQSLRFPREHALRILAAGFLTMGAYMLLFLEGTTRTAPAEAAIVLATVPILTWLLSIAAGQDRFSGLRLAGSLVAFAGVATVILGGGLLGGGSALGGHLFGDALVFAGGLFWAIGIVIARPVLASMTALRFFTLSMIGALPFVLLYGGRAALAVPWDRVDATTWINLTQLVVGSGVLATACYYRGIADLGAARATMYQYFVPVLTAGLAWIFLGQAMHPLQYLGILVVVAGLLLPSLRARRGLVLAPQE